MKDLVFAYRCIEASLNVNYLKMQKISDTYKFQFETFMV